jgi:hypothetical protein
MAALALLALPSTAAAQADDGGTGTATLFVIAGGLVLAFVVVGIWISRDARRSLPPEEREPQPRAPLEPAERKQVRRARAKTTARRRAQRDARRRNR